MFRRETGTANVKTERFGKNVYVTSTRHGIGRKNGRGRKGLFVDCNKGPTSSQWDQSWDVASVLTACRVVLATLYYYPQSSHSMRAKAWGMGRQRHDPSRSATSTSDQASWDQRFVHRSAGADLKLGPGNGSWSSTTTDTCSAVGPASVTSAHQVSGSCPGRGATLPLTYHHSCRLLLLASQRIAASPFEFCQTFNLTCSIMQVSARPLTLNLLFQFNINGSRNLMAEADALMDNRAVWFHSFSSNLYTCLLDNSCGVIDSTPAQYPGTLRA